MATKAVELARANRGEGCLGKARHDEPVFTLRAQDVTSPEVIEFWIRKVAEKGGAGPKLAQAQADAEAFRAWQAEHGCKVPD